MHHASLGCQNRLSMFEFPPTAMMELETVNEISIQYNCVFLLDDPF